MAARQHLPCADVYDATAGTHSGLRGKLEKPAHRVPDARACRRCCCSLAAYLQGEQEEYAREGIAWSYIDFVDNQDCLDL